MQELDAVTAASAERIRVDCMSVEVERSVSVTHVLLRSVQRKAK